MEDASLEWPSRVRETDEEVAISLRTAVVALMIGAGVWAVHADTRSAKQSKESVDKPRAERTAESELNHVASIPPKEIAWLEGDAAWNRDMAVEYFKRFRGIDIPQDTSFDRENGWATDGLNSEFVSRLRLAFAVYAARDGNDLAVVRKTGGLRNREEQLVQWKKCRRLKAPSLKGDQEKDWEVVPVGERVPDLEGGLDPITERPVPPGVSLLDLHPFLTWNDGEARFVDLPHLRMPKGNCAVTKVWGKKTGNPWVEVGTATGAWHSWHNFGLAVDLSEGHGTIANIPQGNSAWESMKDAIGDLGMTWGGWFTWNDAGHVEWHPIPALPASSTGMEPSGHVVGQPAAQEAVAQVYHWRIPKTIFVRRLGKPGRERSGQPRTQELLVYELASAGNCAKQRSTEDAPNSVCWIALQRYRTIERWADGSWRGNWISYDPPVKLFPAYIPTIRFARDRKDSAGDSNPKPETTKVVQVTYHHNRSSRVRSQLNGSVQYTPRFSVHDWQIEANRTVGEATRFSSVDFKESPGAADVYRTAAARFGTLLNRVDTQPWLYFRPVYEIESGFDASSREYAKIDTQTIDAQGNTKETHPEHVPFAAAPVRLHLAWDRDNGTVGARIGPIDVPKGNSRFVLFSDGGLLEVLAIAPHDVHDVATPPDEVPSNPRQSRERKRQPGFIPR